MNLTLLKSGIWQAELRVPEDVREIIGKTRFAKSMRTRIKREAVVKAAPILEQWQSEIDLAKTDPHAFLAQQIMHNARHDFAALSSDSGVSSGHLAWLCDLPPSKGEALYKIGVTSERLGDTRIRQVANTHRFIPILVAMVITAGRASKIEKKILQYGRSPDFDSNLDGYSEFRFMSEAELEKALILISKNTKY